MSLFQQLAGAPELAKAIYHAYCARYGITEQWEALPLQARSGLFEVAVRTLKALEPDPQPDLAGALFTYATVLAREEAARVIGRIAPRT